MRRRRSRKMGPSASIIVVLLAISGLAIGAGYFLSRFLISSFVKQPVDMSPPGSLAVQPSAGSTTPNAGSVPASTPAKDPGASIPSTTTSPKVTPTLPVLAYGQVQLGAFAQDANAQNLAKSVQAQGIPAIVMQRNLYQVVVGMFADRNLAETYSKELEAKGQKDVHLSAAEISVIQAKSFQGTEAELVKTLASLLEDATTITAKSLALSDQLYSKNGDQAAWRKQVGDLSNQVGRLEQIQLPNSQGSALAKEWSGWVIDMKTHLNHDGTRAFTDGAAWSAAQIELMGVMARLQAIYRLLGAS